MRSLEDVLDQFAYHPATPATAPVHDAFRREYAAFAQGLWDLVPSGPEKTIVFRKLQESLMYANLAVALTAPADLGPTSAVARVLPDRG